MSDKTDNVDSEFLPVNFTIYGQDGQVLRTGTAQKEQAFVQARESLGEAVVFEPADPGTQYVSNGEVLDMPPRPSTHHVFNYTSKVWEDPRTLEDLKTAKWEAIKASRDAAEFGGFGWEGLTFDSDTISQGRIQSSAQLASMSPDFATDWTLADNSTRTLNSQDMVSVGEARGRHVDTQHARARELRAAITAATSAEQLTLITF